MMSCEQTKILAIVWRRTMRTTYNQPRPVGIVLGVGIRGPHHDG